MAVLRKELLARERLYMVFAGSGEHRGWLRSWNRVQISGLSRTNRAFGTAFPMELSSVHAHSLHRAGMYTSRGRCRTICYLSGHRFPHRLFYLSAGGGGSHGPSRHPQHAHANGRSDAGVFDHQLSIYRRGLYMGISPTWARRHHSFSECLCLVFCCFSPYTPGTDTPPGVVADCNCYFCG